MPWQVLTETCIAASNKLSRDQVESGLTFAGFLVFPCHEARCQSKALKMLADSSHRVCRLSSRYAGSTDDLATSAIMITGDNPLTAVHVARDVEIGDREVLI